MTQWMTHPSLSDNAPVEVPVETFAAVHEPRGWEKTDPPPPPDDETTVPEAADKAPETADLPEKPAPTTTKKKG